MNFIYSIVQLPTVLQYMQHVFKILKLLLKCMVYLHKLRAGN